ncbi:PaaI family thioesterase [Desulfofustis limnaeus]|uniref:Thioesterase n=1 Tax=Desulfofustis limnaeus TaxID=2740163 RepID=A0ABM7WDM4_9BACT|nr:PaaI family thioesterase [Desulfofustis limnaeus]MDX9896327.1 PaaI family thioesterase [Desulfofustis sp.]BDD89070.1 thioesterase [Desulfofustis limnaeus]
MKHAIKGRQPNSRMCFVCGMDNRYGLQSRFYELDNGEIVACFRPADEHQSYPGRLHGGIAAAILDETIGRAVLNHQEDELWGVTLEFSMKFRKPVPLDQEIRVVARLVEENKRSFCGTGEIILADGSVAIEGSGRYLKMALSKITDAEFKEEEWRVVEPGDADPTELDLPDRR